jgi:alkylation response protein AidB-like acyl-CoA dehydrogenase
MKRRCLLMDTRTVLVNVQEISDGFARDRTTRQRRRQLVQADFDLLRDAGFLQLAVPVEQGGLWESVARSTRPVSEILRTLAHGDSSVALVSSMHPSVLIFWLATTQVPEQFESTWNEQRREVFQAALDGSWWGTITSEPGSGGDISKTQVAATPDPDGNRYRISGQKHFGSGSGITSFMITTAVAEGEAEPDWFYLDMRGIPWNGSAGVKLLAEWDGHGMIGTQSHSMQFDGFPATRIAFPGNLSKLVEGTGGAVACFFTAVIVGIVEAAIDLARERLGPRHESLRTYEQVEWARVEQEGWLIQQAYQGMLRAIEEKQNAARDTLQGKTAIAELAESVMSRICKIMGGGTYNRYAPFGFWFEDVRALGFLRPPWGLAYEILYKGSWSPSASSFLSGEPAKEPRVP